MLKPVHLRMRNRKRQRGQAMVESALVFLIFMCMFIGILDFGQFLYFHQALVDRARAGARYAAVNPTVNDNDVKKYTVYNDANASGSSLPIIAGLSTNMISVVRSGTPGASDATAGVTISGFPVQFLSPFITGSFNTKVAAVLPSEAP